MNNYLLAAAAFTAFTWALHTFVGTVTIARPLLDSEIEAVPKYTNYYCWHGITVVLAVMAGGYLYAALVPDGRDVAILVTGLSVGFLLWGIVLVTTWKQKTLEMPQWVLFAIITALAIPGL